MKDPGASGAILVQGRGKVGVFDAETPSYIRYGERTRDEYFITEGRAKEGYTVVNTGNEPLVVLRYFGPGVSGDMPRVGDHKRINRS